MKAWIFIGMGLLVGSLCGACREKVTRGAGGLEHIRLVEKKTDLKQSDLMEIVDLTPLETKDSCLVGYIPQLIKRPSGFYLVSMGRILKFDLEGHFLYCHEKGRGPKEFLDIGAISVDEKDKYLYLHDDLSKKVICYDAQTGKYVRHVALDYRAFTFMVMPDSQHFIFYCGFSPSDKLDKGRCFPRFIVADSMGKIEKTFIYRDKNVNIPSHFGGKDVFSIADSTVYCFVNYNDTIFRIDPGVEIVPAFVIDYGNENQQKNDRLIRMLSGLEKVEGSPKGMGSEEIIHLSRMVRTAKHCLYVTGDWNFWLYDWEKEQGIDLMGIEDDLMVDYYLMAADADYFYTPVSVTDLKRLIAEKPGKYSGKLLEMAEKLDEDANPLIVKVKVKPF